MGTCTRQCIEPCGPDGYCTRGIAPRGACGDPYPAFDHAGMMALASETGEHVPWQCHQCGWSCVIVDRCPYRGAIWEVYTQSGGDPDDRVNECPQCGDELCP